ncbi:hypothetical protein C8Q78DRAFT_850144 [Trametes maxima]|nr:hypothetical protein C8Q78DRAFT_850144 [Trametes maxima]
MTGQSRVLARVERCEKDVKIVWDPLPGPVLVEWPSKELSALDTLGNLGAGKTARRLRLIDCQSVTSQTGRLKNLHFKTFSLEDTIEQLQKYCVVSYAAQDIADTFEKNPKANSRNAPQAAPYTIWVLDDNGPPIHINTNLLKLVCEAAIALEASFIWLEPLCVNINDEEDNNWKWGCAHRIFSRAAGCIVLPAGLEELYRAENGSGYFYDPRSLPEMVYLKTDRVMVLHEREHRANEVTRVPAGLKRLLQADHGPDLNRVPWKTLAVEHEHEPASPAISYLVIFLCNISSKRLNDPARQRPVPDQETIGALLALMSNKAASKTDKGRVAGPKEMAILRCAVERTGCMMSTARPLPKRRAEQGQEWHHRSPAQGGSESKSDRKTGQEEPSDEAAYKSRYCTFLHALCAALCFEESDPAWTPPLLDIDRAKDHRDTPGRVAFLRHIHNHYSRSGNTLFWLGLLAVIGPASFTEKEKRGEELAILRKILVTTNLLDEQWVWSMDTDSIESTLEVPGEGENGAIALSLQARAGMLLEVNNDLTQLKDTTIPTRKFVVVPKNVEQDWVVYIGKQKPTNPRLREDNSNAPRPLHIGVYVRLADVGKGGGMNPPGVSTIVSRFKLSDEVARKTKSWGKHRFTISF